MKSKETPEAFIARFSWYVYICYNSLPTSHVHVHILEAYGLHGTTFRVYLMGKVHNEDDKSKLHNLIVLRSKHTIFTLKPL